MCFLLSFYFLSLDGIFVAKCRFPANVSSCTNIRFVLWDVFPPEIGGRPRLDESILYTLSDRARVAKGFIIYSLKFNERKVYFTQQKFNEFSDVFWSEIGRKRTFLGHRLNIFFFQFCEISNQKTSNFQKFVHFLLCYLLTFYSLLVNVSSLRSSLSMMAVPGMPTANSLGREGL